MPASYDPDYTAAFYNAYGEREWDRHDTSWAARTSFAVHRSYLNEFIRAGDMVLDAGAGPGRFTIELGKRGARVHACDISPGQLALHEAKVGAAGLANAVLSRQVLDICDLSVFGDETFDAVVCFGGPLSYVMERADEALGELCRVVRQGGYLLLSVMSSVGALRRFLPQVLEEGREFGPEHNDRLVRSGVLPRETNRGHEMRMFRWSELSELLGRHGSVVSASATNFLTAQHDDALDSATDEERNQVQRWELELCRESGAIDGGTHILAVVQPTR